MDLMSDYSATTYKVYLDNEITIDLVVDELNKDLDTFLASQGCKSYAFITAWNPFSEKVDAEQNEIANTSLKKDLDQFMVFDGMGIPAQPSEWEAEASFFILGISKEEAEELGKKYEQNAIVFGKFGEAPILIKLV